MMKIIKNKFNLLLALIIILAVVLRFTLISVFPPSMVQDEVGLGYSAISIAQTGMDEWGNSYPLVFKSFGDYKPPAFFYATALLYRIVGWNFALPRLTSAIAGIFIVLFGALWVRKQFKSDELGLFAGLLFAISPWTIHLSRMALESNLGLAFFMGGLLFLSYAKESKIKLVLSVLLFSLSTYSYHGYRFTVLLFLIGLFASTLVVNIKDLKKVLSTLKVYGLVFLLSTLLSLPGFFSGGATNRLDQTLLITSTDAAQLFEHKQNNCHVTFTKLNPKLSKVCRFAYNSYTKPVIILSESYIQQLSPGFLFFNGDSDSGRNPVQSGELYLVTIPFWVLGIIAIFKKFKKYLPITAGYFIAFIPSAVAGSPHSIRMSVLIPFVVAVIVLGIKVIKKYFNSLFVTPIILLLLFLSLGIFSINYMIDSFATHEYEQTYLSFAKETAQLSHEYIQKGYTVFADYDLYPEPHMYYAYWNRIDPKVTQQSFSALNIEKEGFERPTQFGDYLFFADGKVKSLTCDKEYNKPTVFFTNDPIELANQHEIKENTKSYTFVYVYEMEELRSDPKKLLSFCNE